MTESQFLISLIIGMFTIAIIVAHETIAGRHWNVFPAVYGGTATLFIVAAIRFIVH